MGISMKDRIIVALDVSTMNDALLLVRQLKDKVGIFKIGLQLYTAVGAPAIHFIQKEEQQKIFLDLKFHDTPDTVGRATTEINKLGVHMFSVHALAGERALRMAASNKGRSKLLGITVLTSHDNDECKSLLGKSTKAKVLQFARLLRANRAFGVVCSPHEASMLRQMDEFNDLKLICPGIRPEWAPEDDQKRYTTPKQALELGADYLVIGRAILNYRNEIGLAPMEAVRKILAEMEEARLPQFIQKTSN